MTDTSLDDAKRAAQSWYWWGVPTFFRCPWSEDPAACDTALVGVPHSIGNGSTERDQHLGPRAVRHVSGFYRRAQGVHDFAPFEAARLLQGLKGLDIIGADVVCLMPTKVSPNQMTAQVAMVVMFELLSLIALKHANAINA
jgi:arginase family enzyme